MISRTSKALMLAGSVLFVATACTDTTVTPTGSVTQTNIFTSQASYQQFLAKLYAGLAVSGQQGPAGNPDIAGIDEGFSQYLRLYWELQELPTDEAIIAWGDLTLPELNTMQWSATNTFTSAMYYRIYFQVGMVNEFLRQTTDAALAGRGVSAGMVTTIHGYRAEARFLRALSYWHGLDLYGSIPLVTENDALGATPPKQVSRDSLYNFVVSELTAIQSQLPPSTPANYGRATQQAANMLLAQIYLNSGVYKNAAPTAADMTLAANAAAAVINSGAFKLDTIWRRNFLADNNTSPEIIFPIEFDGTHTQTWGGMTFLTHAACGGQMDNNVYGLDGCWWGLRIRPETFARFDTANDIRSKFFFYKGQRDTVAAVLTFTDGIAAPKFANVTSTGATGSNRGFPDTDFPMFRLADAYLTYAEAVARGGAGSAATAIGYINALRQRAYSGSAAHNVAALNLDTILADRGRELMWEGQRRQDLIRYGLFTTGTYLWTFKGGTQSGVAVNACLNTYPLPQNELVANPNLHQPTGCYGG